MNTRSEQRRINVQQGKSVNDGLRTRCCTGCLSRNNGICKNTGTGKTKAECGVDVRRNGGAGNDRK